ncbi:MAG: endopeptidase La [Tissierellia bacterium]|nr:endopeptidase La [Tissierellia bacterium]
MRKKDEYIPLPLIPLRDLVIFPQMVTHFDAGRPRSIAAIEAAEMGDSYVFLTAQKSIETMEPELKDIYKTGTIANIKQILRLPGGIVRILVEGIVRGRIVELHQDNEFTEVIVEELGEEELPEDGLKLEALIRLLEEDLQKYIELNPKIFPGFLDTVVDVTDPGSFVDTSASYINLPLEDSQSLLDAVHLEQRMTIFHKILTKEIELLTIENTIDQQVKSEMNKVQREYYLKEQMRVIRKELGDGEDGEALEDTYRNRIEEKKLPKEVQEKALKEAKKLSQMNTASPEYTVIVNYLDWILDLPWEESSPEDVNIKEARDILNQEHYGLKDVKERILEFIAVRKLSEDSKGPILCLVGPPGVGKTSIARSMAHALNKEYVRMSLGGVTDEAEIRGHRRTYVGALPGRVISLLKKAGTNNPLFLLDEIDKVGSDYKGDPASGLLEVLDPEQNNTFTDHYLELPFDLSKVFFITTANTTATIPGPLKDRMEVIPIQGYTPDEKFHIAKLHLIPKLLKENGLNQSKLKITDHVIWTLIEYYTREAGVRGLEKEISKIIRKAALQMIEEDLDKVSVSNRNLTDFVGEKKFLFDLVGEKHEVGLVNGLAWTQVGGETLSIEANAMPGKGKVQLTGKLGDVMKESAMAALSYLGGNCKALGLDPGFREKYDIHIHVPEGAVPKDGPSAGISIATAMYSALSGKPVARNIAMTGEITLRGRVLPIGGLKEKLLAAGRMGIDEVIIPFENQRDLKEIDEKVTKGLKISPVKTMDEVLNIAIIRK